MHMNIHYFNSYQKSCINVDQKKKKNVEILSSNEIPSKTIFKFLDKKME